MRKIFAILVSLLFVVSVFGVASLMAGCPYEMAASKDSIAVGQLVTVYSNHSFTDRDPYTDGAAVDKISGPTATSEVIGGVTYSTKWVYKAYTSGTVKFSMCSDFGKQVTVTVNTKPHPMFSFMKILGLGQKD
ncbi:MAG: hypothetical protein GYA51_01620 [Candidatus Methanofastidiosa archaeon]|nr:hypothetical protein [Candidatus Methanofastidiosa archaeon]